MKLLKSALPKGFFAGLFAGAALIAAVAFTHQPAGMPAKDGIDPITATQGNAMVKSYLREALPTNLVVKGMVLMKPQFEAMNKLYWENPELSGFRIYFGKDTAGIQKAIVVGIDEAGKDVVSGSVFSTPGDATGLCPRFCDDQSPLVQ
ncbi:MAG TPA: hypothetical protein P5228_11405 [Bacteroidales bacterium]|nr:hypothetical protein [Bacteroidales bacterium]HRZ48135.1 hypothetical protein [Bacteroidales bacterium]